MKIIRPFSAIPIRYGKNMRMGQPSMITNMDLPSCVNCKFFKPSLHSDYESSFGKCEKFGTKDIVTNEILYDFANECRNNEKKCGMMGGKFEPEQNLQEKMCWHKIRNNKSFIIYFVVFLINSILYTYVISKF
jgi:hypothetical protein